MAVPSKIVGAGPVVMRIIDERLSVRLIIVRALVGSKSEPEVVLVCIMYLSGTCRSRCHRDGGPRRIGDDGRLENESRDIENG